MVNSPDIAPRAKHTLVRIAAFFPKAPQILLDSVIKDTNTIKNTTNPTNTGKNEPSEMAPQKAASMGLR